MAKRILLHFRLKSAQLLHNDTFIILLNISLFQNMTIKFLWVRLKLRASPPQLFGHGGDRPRARGVMESAPMAGRPQNRCRRFGRRTSAAITETAMQCGLLSKHVPIFRVRTVTLQTCFILFLIFQSLRELSTWAGRLK